MEPTQHGSTEHSCIVCGRVVGTARGLRRGLCAADYEKYRRAKTKAEAAGLNLEDWEASLIAKGLILPDARAASDPFTGEVNVMLAEQARANRMRTVSGATSELMKGAAAKERAESPELIGENRDLIDEAERNAAGVTREQKETKPGKKAQSPPRQSSKQSRRKAN